MEAVDGWWHVSECVGYEVYGEGGWRCMVCGVRNEWCMVARCWWKVRGDSEWNGGHSLHGEVHRNGQVEA